MTYIATMSNAGDLSTAVLGPDSATLWMLIDSRLTIGTYSATGGFTCSRLMFFGAQLVGCVGDLGPGAGSWSR